MYALVEIGGKQYKAEKDSVLLVDLFEAKEGQKVKYSTVTMLRSDKDVQVGTPYVAKAVVEAKVEEPLVKGEKQVIFKYKQKVPHRTKRGHRQGYTRIRVTSVGVAKEKAAE